MAEVQKTTQAGEMTQVFIEFVMMHAQNAALFLGQIPNPRGGEVEVNLPLAKMFIDQLAVIREKTRGNLSADEKKVIESALGQLQMAFVEVAQMIKAQNIGADVPEFSFFGDMDSGDAGTAATEAPGEPASQAPRPPQAPTQPNEPKAPEPQPKAEPPQEQPAPRDRAPEAAQEESRKRFTKSYGS